MARLHTFSQFLDTLETSSSYSEQTRSPVRAEPRSADDYRLRTRLNTFRTPIEAHFNSTQAQTNNEQDQHRQTTDNRQHNSKGATTRPHGL